MNALLIKDTQGRCQCQICGKFFRKLGQHIYGKHHMLTSEYKKEYNLNQNTKLTSPDYQYKMRKYINKYYNLVVTQNLTFKGQNTRVQKGDQLRLNKSHNKIIEEVI